MPPVRILTWNILHGGGPARTPAIGLAILAHRPDVVVLTEFRTARGGQLRAQLADAGLLHQQASPVPEGKNGVLVASRLPLDPGSPTNGLPVGRWLAVRSPTLDLGIHAVHVPDDTQPAAKAAAWQFLVSHARTGRETRSIYIGDFNTARHGPDSPGRHFHCERLLGAFCSLGFTDAWRCRHPHAREDSWVSPLGRGRLDAAYLSPPLTGHLADAAYLHHDREAGLSDHAPLLLTLDLDDPPPQTTNTLFRAELADAK